MKLYENKTFYLRENKTGQEHYGCRFRYVFGKDCIRFYFDIKDEEIISPYKEDNEDIWTGDAAEVFISPDGDLTRYKEIEVSPFGVRFYGEVTNEDGKTPRLRKMEPPFKAETKLTEYGYTASIYLALKVMNGFDRKKMKMNAFCLDKKKSGIQELYALNPTFCGSFHRPKYFVSEGSKHRWTENC